MRALKPRLIVETGVDQGLGNCVLTAALKRNYAEGSPGEYLGTEIQTAAGRLFVPPYSTYGRILYGDSIFSLTKIEVPIDLFINDSDHSAMYEKGEYEIVTTKMSSRGIILGDNAHGTDKLLEFGRSFLFFKEEPLGHWYPGAGIGAAFWSED